MGCHWSMEWISAFEPGGPNYYHRPLIPIVLALAGGIFLGGNWPGYMPLAGAAGLLALAGMLLAWSRGGHSLFAPLMLLVVLGYTIISPWLPAQFPDNHIFHYTDSNHWHIQGEVTRILPRRFDRARLIIKVTKLRDGGHEKSVTGCIRLTVADAPPLISPGTRLAFRSRIRSIRNFNNPGGFDYRRYMIFQRVFGSAFIVADRLSIMPGTDVARPSLLDRYRTNARDMIAQLPDENAQAIMRALLIGERNAVSQELRQMFNRCGVGHLLAISGLHIGIIAGLTLWMCQWGLNRFDGILDRGWGRRGAALLTTGPVVLYAILAGLSPSTQRALIMVLAVLSTYFVYKDGDTLNFLSIAALLMLIWYPPALFSISFQLSFAAVAWIVLGLQASSNEPNRVAHSPSRRGEKIKTFLWVTVWATAGTLPLVMLYFQQVSLVGLVTNCLLVPLIGMFVLPVGLAALFSLPFHETVAVWGIQLAGSVLSQALSGMAYLDGWDGIAIETFVPTSIEILCYYTLLGLLAARHRSRQWRWVGLLILAIIAVDAFYWSYERIWHRDLRVTVMDVGQGSAALAELPGGNTMLIDGGGFTSNRFFDVGERIVAPFLRYRRIRQIDTIVLSHTDTDHMNGLVYVLKHFHPKRLIWTGRQASTESFQRFYAAVIGSDVAVPVFAQLDRDTVIGGVQMTILHPPEEESNHHLALLETDSNNDSIVLKLSLGSCAILFPGDIERPAEEQLVRCCREDLGSNVLVAPHHGSRNSSSMDFLTAVHPETIVISAGWQNRFGFPHDCALERYHGLKASIYRTDRDGAVCLRTDGRQWQIETR
mgnify:CR=1 FL=1